MSVLVNFYSANRPDAPDGHELDILGAQVGAGELVDDASNGSIKDADMIVTIRGVTTSWVRIGSAANADECEKVEAGECIVRFLPAGQSVYCDVASTSATDVGLLTDIEAEMTAMNATLASLESIMSAPATSLPHVEPDKTRDLSRALISFNSTSDQDIVALASGQTVRLHKLMLSFAGAATLSIYTGGSGGTLLLAIDIPAAGILNLDFDPRPWAITASGAKLTFKTSSAVAVKGFADYLQSA